MKKDFETTAITESGKTVAAALNVSKRVEHCEVCSAQIMCVITYWREAPPQRIRRPLCRTHAKIIWDALPAPLKETAIIEDAPHSATDETNWWRRVSSGLLLMWTMTIATIALKLKYLCIALAKATSTGK